MTTCGFCELDALSRKTSDLRPAGCGWVRIGKSARILSRSSAGAVSCVAILDDPFLGQLQRFPRKQIAFGQIAEPQSFEYVQDLAPVVHVVRDHMEHPAP